MKLPRGFSNTIIMLESLCYVVQIKCCPFQCVLNRLLSLIAVLSPWPWKCNRFHVDVVISNCDKFCINIFVCSVIPSLICKLQFSCVVNFWRRVLQRNFRAWKRRCHLRWLMPICALCKKQWKRVCRSTRATHWTKLVLLALLRRRARKKQVFDF